MGSVVAKSTVRLAGRRSMLHEGNVFDENDPVVKERPDLFESLEAHRARKARPTSTVDLGERSMSARRSAAKQATEPAPVEEATAAPGQVRDISHPCPEEGCDFVGTSERSMKTHKTKAHG